MRFFAPLLCIILIHSICRADERSELPSKENTLPIGHDGNDAIPIADEVWAAFELVLRHHVDPPTRQSMTLAFCRHVRQSSLETTGLGRVISDASQSELRQIIQQQIDSLPTQDRRERVNDGIGKALNAVASTQLIQQSEHRVQQQLAENRYVGIGIAIGLSGTHPAMLKLFPGGPADRAGAKEGDQIIEVDGEPTQGKSIQQVVAMLRGLDGTSVDLVLKQPKGPRRPLAMTRGVVPINHVGDLELKTPRIGYVRVNSVTSSILRELRSLTPEIRRLGLQAMIIDIASAECPYQPALTLANALIDGKDIGVIQTHDSEMSGETEIIVADPGALWPDLQLALMVAPQVRNALAWAVFGIQKNRDAILVGSLTQAAMVSRSANTGWKYGSIDIPESTWTLRVPVARFLRDTNTPAHQWSTPFIDRTHKLKATTRSQLRDAQQTFPRVYKPVEHAIDLLEKRIGDVEN